MTSKIDPIKALLILGALSIVCLAALAFAPNDSETIRTTFAFVATNSVIAIAALIKGPVGDGS